MSNPTIIVSAAGTRFAVRVVPAGPVDRDRALPSYSAARLYADGLCDAIVGARLDDRCDWKRS